MKQAFLRNAALKTDMTARAVMVLGTTSGAGKSWLTTSLCRWYARQGLKVAPFKAQNMSNNARVVPRPDGGLGEIGSAQYFQALAARTVPDVRMNPVLLKPESDTASQVVVMGQVRRDYSSMPWRSRSDVLWPHAQAALNDLMQQHDVVVIEGAGSPAEINLHDNDFVNMRTALAVQAACLLVTDIDRGGAFAHLFGTHQLLPPHEQALLRGFVLNRFRGDARLLAPGPEQLMALTGVPTMAVLPMWRGHGLPEEDGVFDQASWACGESMAHSRVRVAIVAYPRISNIDEFQPLRNLPNVDVVWARSPRDMAEADWLILPGSKNTQADLAWLREAGLDHAILQHAAAGKPVLGICGGLQMLGEQILDPLHVEGDIEASAGLGLLHLTTRFEGTKTLRHARLRCEPSSAAKVGETPVETTTVWHALHGVNTQGYEIHHGQTHWHRLHSAADALWLDESGRAVGWQLGAVMGVYAHGLLESPGVMRRLFGQQTKTLDDVFDGLANFIEGHFLPGTLMSLLDA